MSFHESVGSALVLIRSSTQELEALLRDARSATRDTVPLSVLSQREARAVSHYRTERARCFLPPRSRGVPGVALGLLSARRASLYSRNRLASAMRLSTKRGGSSRPHCSSNAQVQM